MRWPIQKGWGVVVELTNVLAAQACAELRDWLHQEAVWARGISAGSQALAVKHNLQVPEHAPGFEAARQMVLAALGGRPISFRLFCPSEFSRLISIAIR